MTPDTQAAFHALALSRGVSDSALIAEMIHVALTAGARSMPDRKKAAQEHESASTRVTIRLRPMDAVAIARRAAARELRPATYLALLVHAHVSGETPIPRTEIQELKRAVASLSAVGRNLNQLVAAAHRGGSVDTETRVLLRPIALGVESVRKAVRAHAAGNLVSWSIPNV